MHIWQIDELIEDTGYRIVGTKARRGRSQSTDMADNVFRLQNLRGSHERMDGPSRTAGTRARAARGGKATSDLGPNR